MTLNVAHLTLNVAQCCTTAICRNVNAKCRTLLSAQLCIFSYMCHHVCNEVGCACMTRLLHCDCSSTVEIWNLIIILVQPGLTIIHSTVSEIFWNMSKINVKRCQIHRFCTSEWTGTGDAFEIKYSLYIAVSSKVLNF